MQKSTWAGAGCSGASRTAPTARGEIDRLALFMPPGSAKSTYATILCPAWHLPLWLRTAGWFHVFEGYAAILFFFLLLARVLYKYSFLHKDRAIGP